ncbi:hypothetical protein HHS34_005625 [Acidithiobacillus montserratensis]|uniref:Uncharacterized protein n=1 Tax=Acidithiobacillus montserratensis TaxID=2729135 RepID=A0ACD5HJW9_9PROT|nr:hypothetical protein [Acidithiobacillus montserratensis]MBU2747843.1 hypothetical protein [Acidithiobacillus montserratensis]
MSLAVELAEWADEERQHGSEEHRIAVARILLQLKELPDPDSLPVGTTQRFLAQKRIDRLLERAEELGFETPGKTIKKELGKQMVGKALGLQL